MEKPVKTGFLVGYARVSTQEQNLDMQIEALQRADFEEKFAALTGQPYTARRVSVPDED